MSNQDRSVERAKVFHIHQLDVASVFSDVSAKKSEIQKKFSAKKFSVGELEGHSEPTAAQAPPPFFPDPA